MEPKTPPHRQITPSLVLRRVYESHIELVQIVYPVLWRILIRLPRNITAFRTLSEDQRRYLLERIATGTQAHTGSPPTQGLAYLPTSRHDMSRTQMHTYSSALPEAGPVLQQRPGELYDAPGGTLSHSTTGDSSKAIKLPAYSLVVNIGGTNNVINTDDLLSQMSRQARICQTRERKRLSQMNGSSCFQERQNNFIINVNGSGCIVGGHATIHKVAQERKRQHGEIEQHGNGASMKDEHAGAQPPTRRQRQE